MCDIVHVKPGKQSDGDRDDDGPHRQLQRQLVCDLRKPTELGH